MDCPIKVISPDLGGAIPDMDISVVVFPAPFAPIRVTISPSAISISIPFRAWIVP
jgi:hypothetical protein